MSLTAFIHSHHEEIISEFAAFAKTLMPPGVEMTTLRMCGDSTKPLTKR